MADRQDPAASGRSASGSSPPVPGLGHGVLDSRQGAWDRAERRYREHRAALEEVSYLASRRRRDRS